MGKNFTGLPVNSAQNCSFVRFDLSLLSVYKLNYSLSNTFRTSHLQQFIRINNKIIVSRVK